MWRRGGRIRTPSPHFYPLKDSNDMKCIIDCDLQLSMSHFRGDFDTYIDNICATSPFFDELLKRVLRCLNSYLVVNQLSI